MIQAIGVMIGAYIITRMFELMAKVDQNSAVKAFAVVTVLVTLGAILVVLVAGASAPLVRMQY